MSSLLNISGTLSTSRANGPGTRCVIWVQGCTIGCRGCFSPHTHAHTAKHLIEPSVLAKWVVSIDGIEGLTISGGEPFEQAAALSELLSEVKHLKPELTVFAYTGYTISTLRKSPDAAIQSLLSGVDLLCAGPFIANLSSDQLLWKGSSNQELVYLSNRYNSSTESTWLKQSPIEEYHLDSDIAIHTGFKGKTGLGLTVIGHALPINQR